MHLSRSGLGKLLFGAALLALAGCASAKPEYATKADLAALRTELMTEIRKGNDAAMQQAAASAAAAQQAAADAKAAADKADAIFKQSLQK